MPQYILIVEYDGSRFYGFQRQHSKNADGDQEHGSSSNNYNKDVFKVMKKKPRVDPATGLKQFLDHPKITIQDCLECAILHWISSTLKEESWSLKQLTFRFAGRTDKGVHARGQVVTIQLPDNTICLLDCWQIQKAINGRLPVDISISNIFQSALGKEIHPRADAKHKQYSYSIRFQRADNLTTNNNNNNNTSGCISSQTFRYALSDSPCLWSCPWALNDADMTEICRRLQGTHDYSAFVHKDERAKTDNTLTVTRFDFQVLQVVTPKPNSSIFLLDCPSSTTTAGTTSGDQNDGIHINANDNDNGEQQQQQQQQQQQHPVIILGKFVIESKGFRRNMVRNMVGFAVDVCRGVQSEDDIESLWAGTDEAAAKVKAAPASGLCLEYVKF